MAGKKQEESSVEDILNSIRDIISNEPEGEAQATPAEDSDVLELTDKLPEEVESSSVASVEEPVEAANISTNDDILSDIDSALEKVPEPIEEKVEEKPEPVSVEPPTGSLIMTPPESVKTAAVVQKKNSLLADNAAQKSTAALTQLAASVQKPRVESPGFRSGETLENLVVEALKPMLSSWLNHNLPSIVEKLVQKEIKKLTPESD